MIPIKTVQDVQSVPEDQHIWTINFTNGTCPFCGANLLYKTIKTHYGEDRLYNKCDCEVSKAAEIHNKRVREIQHEAWLQHRKEEQRKRQESLHRKKDETDV